MEWAEQQSQGPPHFRIGDVVEFKVGGFGVIDGVTKPHDGWPSSYSTQDVEGMPAHSKTKMAWHYEGDFKKLSISKRLLWSCRLRRMI